MAVSIERTGEKSFIARNDDVNEPWLEAECDYSTSPPTIRMTMRWISESGETWTEIDALLLQIEGGS